MGVVSRKLRVDPVCHPQQFLGIGDIADIGCGFGGEHRKIRQAQDLRILDLGIPIGPFHKPDHDFAIQTRREIIKVINDIACPLAIGLNHDAKTVPTF